MKSTLLKKNYLTFALVLLIGTDSCKNKENDYLVTISTKLGDIQVVLFDETPKHKDNFLKLVEEKHYDGMAIHFLFKQFMMVTGDPKTKTSINKSEWGLSGAGYTIPAEINQKFKFKRGVLASIREEDKKNPTMASDGSAFAIILNKYGLPAFEGKYTIFGQVIGGYEVIEKLEMLPVNEAYQPLKDLRITIKAKPMTKTQISSIFGYKFL